jgi:hypothetical protein
VSNPDQIYYIQNLIYSHTSSPPGHILLHSKPNLQSHVVSSRSDFTTL